MDPWDVIKSLKIKQYYFNDKLLNEGNKYCQPFTKLKYFDEDYIEEERPIICNDKGCNTYLDSIRQLEAHQKARHTHFCVSCHLVLPSHHLLDRHILEVHDSFFLTLAQKKPMYACLLETCKEVFQNACDRKIHCIHKHSFPYDFRFDLQWKKLDTRPNKNLKKSNLKFDEEMKDPDTELVDMEVENSTTINPNISKKTSKVPANISFGIGVPKTFNKKGYYSKGKYWHQREKSTKTRKHIEYIDLNDIGEALDQ